MKFALAFFCTGLLLTAWAEPQKTPAAVPGEPLSFVRTAADVASNLQLGSLNGFLGLYISADDWLAAVRDADLAPFMKLSQAERKEGRSAACLFSPHKDTAMCVYFDDATPFGVAAVKAGADGKIAESNVAAGYKPISTDMVKKSGQKLKFEPNDTSTDEGYQLPGFLITNR